MKITVFLFLILLFTSAAGQSTISNYAAALRLQSQRTESVSNELMEMVRQNEKNRRTMASVGRRYLAEIDRSIQIVDSYRNAKTRFGLQSEIDDMTSMFSAIKTGQWSLATLAGKQLPVSYSTNEVNLARQQFNTEIVPLIKELVDMRLGSLGAADFLTDPGFDQAAFIVASRIGTEVRASFENEIRKIVGVRIRVGSSLKDHLLRSARTLVSRKVDNVLLRLAANHFVVEMLAVKILEWIGPRLREFLRPKGNLDARTARAVAGMQLRSRDLYSMSSEADIDRVRRTVAAAENHIKANNPLRGDLQRSRRNDLYQKLAAEEKALLRAISISKTRFLMGSPLVEVPFGKLIAELRSARQTALSIIEELERGPGTVAVNPGGRNVTGGGTDADFVVWLDPGDTTCCPGDTNGEPNYGYHGTRSSLVRPNAIILRRFRTEKEMKDWTCNRTISPHFWAQTYAKFGNYHVTRVPCPVTRRE